MKQEYAFKALENKRIKVSIIDELNDPFEFLPRFLDSNRESQEKLFFKWKAEISKKRGIVCFSKRWINPLLWSHYADKHEGFALGFDIPDNVLYKVKYKRKQPLWTWNEVPQDNNLVEPFLHKLASTKFSSWVYEEEFRYGCTLSDCIQEGKHYFENFDSKLILKEIIAGCRSMPSNKFSNLLNRFKDVTVIKAEMDSKCYKIVPHLQKVFK
jgi:hypothetical protein